jgi:endonuclease/exonuclease/phosphatase family metal-dependent hydrolase
MRLLTYNIHKGIGGRDRRYSLERIVEVLDHQKPDLLCLQEVDHNVRRSRHDDQPRRLAEELGLEHRLYQLNHRLKEGGYGNLILSRWPFLDRHQISLKMGWRKTRGAQIVHVETPSGILHLVNWHLGLAEHERHWQVNHLLDHHLFRRSAHLPTLIAGDTNDWRQTLARGPFALHGFHQITAPPSRFRSFPAYVAVGSLDKIYSRGGIVVAHAHVVHSRVARDASDHLPVLVEFDLADGDATELANGSPAK